MIIKEGVWSLWTIMIDTPQSFESLNILEVCLFCHYHFP